MDSTELEVCVDCIQLVANGEVTDGHGADVTAQHTARIVAIWGEDFDITLGRVDPEPDSYGDGDDPEDWFSWRSCEGCGSTLGGDRNYATAWYAGIAL